MSLPIPPVPPVTEEGFESHTWQRWFELVRNAVRNGQDVGSQLGLKFDNLGLMVVNPQTGNVQARFMLVPVAANYFQIIPAAAGSSPTLKAVGTDTNIDLTLSPAGTGLIQASYAAGVATSPPAFSPTRWLAFKDGDGRTIYLAGSLAPW